MTVSPLRDETGRIVGASKVARDITQRKRQEEELRRWKNELEIRVRERTSELLTTQERLMKMTSQLSLTEQRERRKLARDLHDYLAQMLVVGQMKAKMLQKTQQLNVEGATLVQDMDRVFQDALDYTRTLIAELSPPSLQDSDLPSALKWLAERFEKDGLRVEVRSDCACVPVAEEQAVVVFQAVRELLFNVMKHAEVDRATVTVSLIDHVLEVAVSDRGKGVSPEAWQRSTEPGHLGLVSVRERFHAMGGRADVESLQGQGTTVMLHLPLGGHSTAGAQPLVSSPKAKTQDPTHSSMLIRALLVEDHPVMRQALREILALDDRIRVVGEAGNCEEALILAANLAPDVLISDVNLPGINGIETTKQLKALHPQLTVIGLSVHTDEQTRCEMVSAGAEALVSKECASDDLIAAIITSYDKRSRAMSR